LDALAAEWPITLDDRARIGEIAEGNPLFLEQLVAMLAEAGPAPMPPTIQAVLSARLDRLAPAEQAALQRAAVAGREFSLAAVADLSPEDERREVAATLLALVRKEFVRPAPDEFPGDDGFSFRHALIRDAAYAEIPKLTRADLHERFAGWIEVRGADDALVGYHLEQAARCRIELAAPDERLSERAGRVLAAAGRKAASHDDMPAARNLLERALALGDLAEDRPAALRGLAAAQWAMGAIDAAEASIDEAIEVARRLTDVRQEWYARLERAARRHQLHAAGDDLGEVAVEAVRVFNSLGDDAGLCRAWRRLALLSYSRGRGADAAAQAERALEHARRAGDVAEVTRTADLFCSALVYGPDPALSAAARCRALLGGGEQSRVLDAAVTSALAYLAAMQASFDEAREHASRATAIYEDLRLPLLRAGLAQVVGAIEVLAGDLDAAQRELRRGHDLFAEAGAIRLAGHVAASLARVEMERGEIDAAEELLGIAREAVDDGDLGGFVAVRLAAARLAHLRGRADAAIEFADEAVTRLEGTDGVLLADALTVHALVSESDFAPAIELHERKGNIAAAANARTLAMSRASR
jgi:tetratricopeptide (TPR) repeat protein